MRVCVRVCVRVYVRMCMCTCVRACVHVCAGRICTGTGVTHGVQWLEQVIFN